VANRARNEGRHEVVLCIADTIVGRAESPSASPSPSASRGSKKPREVKPAGHMNDTGLGSESEGGGEDVDQNASKSGKSSAPDSNHATLQVLIASN
jgi:hypothetical protein